MLAPLQLIGLLQHLLGPLWQFSHRLDAPPPGLKTEVA